MSNSIIMWSMFFIPWLSLFFMKKEEVKRWMPVTVFAVLLTTIIHDIGTTLGFWATREAPFPFNQMLPYYFGTMPVLTMWVFKFTYGRFWPYMVTNTILDIGFNFFLLNYFLPSRGVFEFNISPLSSLPITIMHAVVIYGYQMWQDDVFARTERISASPKLHPTAAKPLPKNFDKED